MKIQAIRALAKEEKRCVIYTNARGRQWIGTGTCMFLGEEDVTLTVDAMPGLLDLNEDEQKKIVFEARRLESEPIYPAPRYGENETKGEGVEIKYDKCYIPLYGNGRTYLVDARKVRAAVSSTDYRMFYLARNEEGLPLIIVSDGMVFTGVVMPEAQSKTEEILLKLRGMAFRPADGWREEEPSQSPDGASVSHEGEALGEQMTMEDADV